MPYGNFGAAVSQNLTIEDLLGQLRQEGELDSQGAFTLDAKMAVQKLSKFQLEDPSAYLAKIVQAAVASRASSCSLKIGLLDIECWLPGAQYDVNDLGSIPGELLKSGESAPERHHLAVALNAAISTVIARIELAGSQAGQGQKVVWKSGNSEVSQWSPPTQWNGSGGLYLRFSRNPDSRSQAIYDVFGTRDFIGMITGAESGWTRDEKVLHEKFDLCPIPVRVNGRLINCSQKSFSDYYDGRLWVSGFSGLLLMDSFSQELHFSSGPEQRQAAMQVRVKSSLPQTVQLEPTVTVRKMVIDRKGRSGRLASPGDLSSCTLWAGLLERQRRGFLREAPGTRVMLIDDGFLIFDQTFDLNSVYGGSGSGVVVASAQGLQKDLSTLQLVENEALFDKVRCATQLMANLAKGDLERAIQDGLALI